jgi:hypothetical protein
MGSRSGFIEPNPEFRFRAAIDHTQILLRIEEVDMEYYKLGRVLTQLLGRILFNLGIYAFIVALFLTGLRMIVDHPRIAAASDFLSLVFALKVFFSGVAFHMLSHAIILMAYLRGHLDGALANPDAYKIKASADREPSSEDQEK